MRGQAFETMMLVISVIVAITILTILLGFLGTITFGATDLKSVTADLLKSVERKGVGIETKDKAELGAGVIVTAGEIVAGTAVGTGEVEFYCATAPKSARLCGPGGPIKVVRGPSPPGRITGGKSKVNVAVAVCKGEGHGGNYLVCIGHADEVGVENGPSDYCARECQV